MSTNIKIKCEEYDFFKSSVYHALINFEPIVFYVLLERHWLNKIKWKFLLDVTVFAKHKELLGFDIIVNILLLVKKPD